MRYVIVIAAIAFFMVWDVVYNQGQYIDAGVKVLSNVIRHVTG